MKNDSMAGVVGAMESLSVDSILETSAKSSTDIQDNKSQLNEVQGDNKCKTISTDTQKPGVKHIGMIEYR